LAENDEGQKLKCRSKKISCKFLKILLDKRARSAYNAEHKATASLSNGAQRRLFPFLHIKKVQTARKPGQWRLFGIFDALPRF
jgi:hypothetical protein